MLNIRFASRSDVDDILSLIRAKAEFDGCLHLLKAQEKEIEEAFFSQSPKAEAIVAEIDGKIIGIATFYAIYSTFVAKPGIWLDDLFVYESFRKSGAGAKLVKKLCSIARSRGCGRIDWIVARDNENGRGFYDSLGAQIFEEVRHARLDEFAIDRLIENW